MFSLIRGNRINSGKPNLNFSQSKSFQAIMERFWAVQVLLLAGLILGEACSYCVSREECQKEISTSFYTCSITQVCCEVLRSNSQETDTGYGGKVSLQRIFDQF